MGGEEGLCDVQGERVERRGKGERGGKGEIRARGEWTGAEKMQCVQAGYGGVEERGNEDGGKGG